MTNQAQELADALEVVRKLAKEARDAEANCNRTIELLQPEWERFERKDGTHNTFVARLYAEHTSAARRNKKDADALERVLTSYDAGSQKMDPVTVEAMVDVIASAKARWTMGDKTGPDFDALKAQHAAMASVQYQAAAIIRSLGSQS